jgi:hypothetical protein
LFGAFDRGKNGPKGGKMNDKQTTAFVVLLIIAFVFWLYNVKSADGQTSKLKKVVDEIRGVTATAPAPGPSIFDPVPSHVPGVYVTPGSYNYYPHDNSQSVNNTGMDYQSHTNAFANPVGLAYQFVQNPSGVPNVNIVNLLQQMGYANG